MLTHVHEGLPVPGYRPQPAANIDLVTYNKRMEEACLRRLDELAGMAGIDKRWLAVGRTELENAWMAINRAVFMPSRVALPDDDAKGA